MPKQPFTFRKNTRWVLAGVPIILIVYYFAFFNAHLKWGLSKIATRVNLAKVDINKVSFSLWKRTLTIQGIQISNYRLPLKNFLEIRKAVVSFDPLALLSKKVHFTEIDVEGVEYNTDRSESGALSFKEVVGTSVARHIIPSLYRPIRKSIDANPLGQLSQLSTSIHVGAAIKQQTSSLRLTKLRQETQNTINNAKDEWIELETKLPSASDTASLVKRWKTLETQLRHHPNDKTLNQELVSVRQISDQYLEKTQFVHQAMLKKIGSLQAHVKEIDRGLADDTRTLKVKLGIPDLQIQDMSHYLFGDKLLNGLERVTAIKTILRRLMPPAEDLETGYRVQKVHPYSTTYHYPSANKLPRLLIEHGRLRSDGGGSHGATLKGAFNELSSSPSLSKVPTRFELSGELKASRIKDIAVSIKADHRKKAPKDVVSFRISQFPIRNWVTLSRPGVAFEVIRAQAGVRMDCLFKEDRVEARLQLDLKDAKYRVRSKHRGLVNRIRQLNRKLKDFTLVAEISGPYKALKMNMQSELGTQLASALHTQFAGSVAILEADLRKQLAGEARAQKHRLSTQVQKLQLTRLPTVSQRLTRLQALSARLPRS